MVVSMISSCILALQFHRRSNRVVNITHGMVVVWMENLPSFMNRQIMLLLFKQCLRTCSWFDRFLYFSLRNMISIMFFVSWMQKSLPLRFCGAVMITHGMVMALTKNIFLCALRFQRFLHVMDAICFSFV